MKEFNFVASSLGFFNTTLYLLLYGTIGLVISQLLLPKMLFTRLILTGVITLVLLQGTMFLYKYKLKIIFNSDQIEIYKNSKLFIRTSVSDVEKLQSRDIDDPHAIGDLRFYVKNRKMFYFSLFIVSSAKTKIEQEKKLREVIHYFTDRYGFVKKDHMTKLGKSKYLFEYINPKEYE